MGKSKVASPTTVEFTAGGRSFRALAFLNEGEDRITQNMLLARAGTLNARIDQTDGQWILAHAGEIPPELEEVKLVCADWRLTVYPYCIAVFYHNGLRWCHTWWPNENGFSGNARLLARVR